jgi:hypothetical protein
VGRENVRGEADRWVLGDDLIISEISKFVQT